MTLAEIPCLELALLAALLGFVAVLLSRAMACAVACSFLVLAFALGEWLRPPGSLRWLPFLAVDGLSAPLLPLTALLHLAVALLAPRAEADRGFFALLMASLTLQLATFGSAEPWLLAGLLIAGAALPWAELALWGKPSRVFVLHLGLFAVLLASGLACFDLGAESVGGMLLAGAILLRCGTMPGHAWVADLLERCRLGTALLFLLPLPGVYAGLRLVLPMQAVGSLSLVTALVAAGLAVVQRDARRMVAFLILSQSSLVLVGLELRTPVGLTASLSLWLSSVLSLGGLALVLWALEARFGRLGLEGHSGLQKQCPALAAGFLLMGLASVGFPGTSGFVAVELLTDGAVMANRAVGLAVVVAGLLNGIAVVRAYFRLFTGARHESMVPLGITLRERLAVGALSLLVLVGGIWPQPNAVSRHKVAKALLGRAES